MKPVMCEHFFLMFNLDRNRRRHPFHVTTQSGSIIFPGSFAYREMLIFISYPHSDPFCLFNRRASGACYSILVCEIYFYPSSVFFFLSNPLNHLSLQFECKVKQQLFLKYKVTLRYRGVGVETVHAMRIPSQMTN